MALAEEPLVQAVDERRGEAAVAAVEHVGRGGFLVLLAALVAGRGAKRGDALEQPARRRVAGLAAGALERLDQAGVLQRFEPRAERLLAHGARRLDQGAERPPIPGQHEIYVVATR